MVTELHISLRDSLATIRAKLGAYQQTIDDRMTTIEARLAKCERDRANTLRLWEDAGLLGQSEAPAG